MKPIIPAVAIAAVLNALSQFTVGPGVSLALRLLEPGYYFIVSASIAAAMYDRKSFVLLILVLILIIGYPADLPAFARLLIPLGIGIIAGSFLRKLMTEEQRHGTEPSPR